MITQRLKCPKQPFLHSPSPSAIRTIALQACAVSAHSMTFFVSVVYPVNWILWLSLSWFSALLLPKCIHHPKLPRNRCMRSKDFETLQFWKCFYSWLIGNLESMLKIIFPQNFKGRAPLSYSIVIPVKILILFFYIGPVFALWKLLVASFYPQHFMMIWGSSFIHMNECSTCWSLSICRLVYFNSGKFFVLSFW